ncbi:MAG: DUF2974 domain-containing protein [Lachnospiraceae bacterium]|nr:DUF2974 domain-containing protein [Lachnospiraceae bacterium]
MDTIKDHIKWLGHETFEQRPFDEIDNLIFCQLSYYDLSVTTEKGGTLTLEQCGNFTDPDDLHVCIVGEDTDREINRDFFEAAVNAPRYKDILVSDYVDIVNDKVQFAAVTFHISEKEVYVAYRGTDDTLIGWKEDFMISFTEIPAQKMAAEYLENIMKKYSGREICIGGHSKGGNLALYAALRTGKDNVPRISHIYMNDAPGICSDVTDISRLDELKDRITRIIPEFCVVGRLFEPVIRDEKIVRCTVSGIMQHMLLNWGIEYGKLMTADDNTPESNWISEAVNTWIEDVSNEKRHQLVDRLFEALEANGAKTLSDLSGNGIEGFEQILVDLAGADKETLHTIASFPEKAIFGNAATNVRKNTKLQSLIRSRLAQGIAAILTGIMCLVIPSTNMIFIFVAVVTALLILLAGRTIYRLYRSGWNLYQERIMVLITVIALVSYQFMFFKEHALFLLSSIFFGIVFLMAAYNCACALKKDPGMKKWIKIRYLIEMVLFIILGLFDFVSPQYTMDSYASSVGALLVLDGFSRIVEHTQEKEDQG